MRSQISEFGILDGGGAAWPTSSVAMIAALSEIRIFLLGIRPRFYLISPPCETKTIIALLAAAIVATNAQSPATYTPQEAAKHVGETATVTGKMDGFL